MQVFLCMLINENFPKPLQSLYEPMYTDLEYHKLLDTCESVSSNVTEEMAKYVKETTKSQSKSNLRFRYRAGHITASRMKTVCHTNPASPSQSYNKKYLLSCSLCFYQKQTNWGMQT